MSHYLYSKLFDLHYQRRGSSVYYMSCRFRRAKTNIARAVTWSFSSIQGLRTVYNIVSQKVYLLLKSIISSYLMAPIPEHPKRKDSKVEKIRIREPSCKNSITNNNNNKPSYCQFSSVLCVWKAIVVRFPPRSFILIDLDLFKKVLRGAENFWWRGCCPTLSK